MLTRMRPLLLPALAAGVLAAGCGGELDRANDAIDEKQRQVDRARDAVEDPAGTARREADKALEDAVSQDDQP